MTRGDGEHGGPPGLGALFLCFLRLGLQAWGGGLSAWMRREVVVRRGWMADGAFLSGLALAQVAPGANAVNLAVFIGTTLRGGPGALASLAGLVGVPAVLVLAAGAVLLRQGENPVVDAALAGLGAAAVGLILANGVQITRDSLRGVRQLGIVAVLSVGVGVLGWPLVPTLLVAIPASVALMALGVRRP